MNISQQIIDVIDNLAQKFGIVIDWGQQNIMPYLQELCSKYITWEIGTSIVWIVVGILLLIFCVIGTYVFVKTWKEEGFLDETDGATWLFVIGVIAGICGFAVVITQTFDIVKCCTFPELQLFEYVKSLLK